MKLVLASTSKARKRLLARLGLPFLAIAPDYDESCNAHLPPYARALANACGKAEAGARLHPNAWVIGADQVGVCAGIVLEKPGNMQKAAAMLRAMRGKLTCFYTACVLRAPDGCTRKTVVETTLRVRQDLTDEEILHYLARERPLDSAGSFYIEGLGIALMDFVASKDPTALEGLPLIALARWLQPLRSQTSNTSGQGESSPGSAVSLATHA